MYNISCTGKTLGYYYHLTLTLMAKKNRVVSHFTGDDVCVYGLTRAVR
jgi:hypothetical protein